MNEISKEKYMTAKELAEVLEVDVRTVQRVSKSLLDPATVLTRVINGGAANVFNEKQATLIKQEIQKHHNLKSRQIDNVNFNVEKNENDKYMTTKELADTLGVDVKTIQRAVQSLDMNVERIGSSHTMVFNEAQATAIKIELQNHSKVSKNGFETLTIMNDIEMMIIQKQLEAYRDRRIAELQAENDRQKELLTIQAPKVEFYDCVTGSADTMDMSEVAKVLNCGIGRNKLFELLRAKKVFNNKNQPYQKYVDLGLFRIIETRFVMASGEERIHLKTVVFQKGLDFIRQVINKSNGGTL